MKKTIFAGIVSLLALTGQAQTYNHHFMLAGASFAVPENGWFELVCEAFNAEPLNKAVSGDAIKHTASDMYRDRFYTTEELDRVDAFIIMHVHNQDVASTNGIKENYEDYSYDEVQQYNTAYDYVIKRYKADCYNLKFNPESKYYQTENGKPATIILCTHWHDSRVTYNQSIRTLAERWQLPLVEWDENIGFTRKEVDPDGRQPSIKYAADTEKIYDITFGWHPLRGKEQYIQQKMAAICMEKLTELFTPIPASVEVCEKSRVIAPDEKGYFECRFTGVPPWSLTYTVNGEEHRLDDITTSPLLVEIDPVDDETIVLPVTVSNSNTESGTVAGEAHIFTGESAIAPTFDTYVHQANKTTAYVNDNHLEIKGNTDTHTREAYLSFATSGIDPGTDRIALRAYYYDCIYPSWPRKETHPVEIWGNTESYTTLTWDTKPDQFTRIGESPVSIHNQGHERQVCHLRGVTPGYQGAFSLCVLLFQLRELGELRNISREGVDYCNGPVIVISCGKGLGTGNEPVGFILQLGIGFGLRLRRLDAGFLCGLPVLNAPADCTDNENQNHDQRHACNDDRQIGFLENLHLGALFPPGVHRLLGGLFIHRAFHLSCILLSL